jgi:predicted Rossmann fold nucleotide-binding protein DprA/Smf involved in DNA uptake
MPNHSNASLAALLLTQRLVETDAAPLKASEYWSLLERIDEPERLMGLDAAAIASTTGVNTELAERVVHRLDSATAFAFQLDEASQTGLRLISSFDEEYPQSLVERLGKGAPPLLYLVGPPELLRGRLLGVVGSRQVTESGAGVARKAAMAAVAHGVGVVSGAAKGVDQLAMWAALDSGGVAVGVLADSLTRATRDPEIRRAIAEDRLCLCTPFKPTSGFTVATAMARNKIIYVLSEATLVVAADAEKGGTWSGATEAIRRSFAPVVVWTGDGAGEGNSRLVALGGTALDSIKALFPLPTRPDASTSALTQSQLPLEL